MAILFVNLILMLKKTKQKKAILEVLKNTRTHPDAYWVYKQVKQKLPSISLGTVYRNLGLLAECGEIMELDLSSGLTRYDACTAQHYHFRCIHCQNIYDVDIPVDYEIDRKVNELTGFQVFCHKLEFRGICPNCKK